MRGHFRRKTKQINKPLSGGNFIKINKDLCLTLGENRVSFFSPIGEARVGKKVGVNGKRN